jgi:hypothetical protein
MRRVLAIGLAAAGAAAGASAAHAATLQVDHGCYLARQPGLPGGQLITFAGAGFAPNGTVTAQLDGAPFATGTASAAGTVHGTVPAPALPARTFERRSTIAVGDGSSEASATFPVSRLAADLQPPTGPPATLRVRFHVYGFGPVLTAQGRSTSARVYEHVLAPNGRLRATYDAGRTTGPCGRVTTSRRRILPFAAPEDGRWRFVFTTRRRYRATDAPLAAVGFQVRTVFRPA